jgi:TatD DNase family protein
MTAGLVDTHCHLADDAFDEDRGAVIERALAAGVSHVVAVGGGGPIEASEQSAELAAQYDFMRSTAGIHPHDASGYDDRIEGRIERLLALPDVVAVGETGLDYHYDHSPRTAQRSSLARHVALARKHGVPIVLHCRDAESDLREVLSAEAPEGLGGVVHCFTGGYDDARWYLDYGLTISLTGIVTFKAANALRDVVRRLPLDRLMVETDAPYLAPTPYRGKRNEPAYVRRVAETLAELHGTTLDEVALHTTSNARRLFFDP